MCENITLGQYYPGDSYIHLLDPRTKILAVIFIISGILFAQQFNAYLLVTGFIMLIVYISAIPAKLVLRSLKPMWPIIVITILMHFFSTPGRTLLELGVFKVTAEGIRQGLAMALRLVLLIVISSMLTYTTSPIRLTDGMEYLLKPFKKLGLPTHELALMMTIALRFIPTLLSEANKIVKAQTARGADFTTGNLFTRARNMVSLLVPLFISAFRRADELAIAMEARCYQGGDSRNRMKVLKMGSSDLAAIIILAILLLLLILLWSFNL